MISSSKCCGYDFNRKKQNRWTRIAGFRSTSENLIKEFRRKYHQSGDDSLPGYHGTLKKVNPVFKKVDVIFKSIMVKIGTSKETNVQDNENNLEDHSEQMKGMTPEQKKFVQDLLKENHKLLQEITILKKDISNQSQIRMAKGQTTINSFFQKAKSVEDLLSNNDFAFEADFRKQIKQELLEDFHDNGKTFENKKIKEESMENYNYSNHQIKTEKESDQESDIEIPANNKETNIDH